MCAVDLSTLPVPVGLFCVLLPLPTKYYDHHINAILTTVFDSF